MAVITGDVAMGAGVADAAASIRLVMLVNDVSLRNLIPGELAKGFGFFQSKAASAFSPVAVTPDELDATIVAPADSKGYVQLKVGMMKMRAPLSDLRTLTATQQLVKKEQKKLERKKSMREARVDITTRAVRQELDVRGMALDEAIPEVEKFIDDAMLSSLGEVSIIHGNGTGVLRAGIQDCLRRHPCVSSFRLGRYGEGETGVTIVSLK